MKNLILVCLSLIVVVFSSCRQDWGCECVENSTGTVKDTYIITKSSRKVADGRCSDNEYSYGNPTTCTIKE